MSKENKLRVQRAFAILEPLAHAAAARRGYLVDIGFVGRGADYSLHIFAARVPCKLQKKYLSRTGDPRYLLRHRRPGYSEVQRHFQNFEAMKEFLLEMGAE